MISIDVARKAVRLARAVAKSEIRGVSYAPSRDLRRELDEDHGAFVTLSMFPGHDLRACIGYPEPFMTLGETVMLSAKGVVHDFRFPELTEEELNSCTVGITVLTKPVEINYTDTADLVRHIEIGVDGLAVGYGEHRAIFLPQVPVEQNWGVEEYLSHLCMKAGLRQDAWKSNELMFKTFQGETFEEKEPFGEIMKKEW